MNNIQTLAIQFENEISFWEIPLLRGSVIHTMEHANVLFHNHLNDDQYRYRYPLIQYKRINKRAAIVCVGEGTEAIGEFFGQGKFDFNIGSRLVNMKIDKIEAKRTIVQVWDSEFYYRIRKWLPFNSDNYREYKKLNEPSEQEDFLRKILIGNILSFFKGFDIQVDKEIKCIIMSIIDSRTYTHKGVKMMGFDIEFKTNVSLPDFIGLGKGVSMGFGTITSRKNK